MNKCISAAVTLTVLLLLGCSRERLSAPPSGPHKRASASMTYYLDKAAGDALELGVRESFQLWSDATVFKFSYAGRVKGSIAHDGRNEVLMMTRWPNELPIGEAAWCQVYLDASGKIAEADILLNAQAFAFTTKRERREAALYVEDVLAKEIGLSLGIGLGEDDASRGEFRVARAGEAFEPGIDPAEMAGYLSLYEAKP